jgi:hypothetical protein
MNATSLHDAVQHDAHIATLLTMQVEGDTCTVRAATVWPIAEVLDFEEQFDGAIAAAAGDVGIDADLIADMLDSRMIAPPRPRRRRQKAVSSRAHFYAG